MLEEEVRYVVRDYGGALKLVEDSDAEFKGEEKKHDTYYGNSDLDGAFVRIRISDGKEEVTFKGRAEKDGELFRRIELNGTVNDPQKKLKEVLLGLGLKKLSENKSVRKYWELDGVEIVVSRFTYPAKLDYIEFEREGITKEWVKEKFPKISEVAKPVDDTTFVEFDKSIVLNIK